MGTMQQARGETEVPQQRTPETAPANASKAVETGTGANGTLDTHSATLTAQGPKDATTGAEGADSPGVTIPAGTRTESLD